jgi:hypothetical protein
MGYDSGVRQRDFYPVKACKRRFFSESLLFSVIFLNMQKKEVEKNVILCNNSPMEVQHEILHLQR